MHFRHSRILYTMPDQKKRFHFIDLLKAYAVLMMIQGHTLDAVLNPADKLTGLYQFLHMLRGLTAPAFLLAAGFGMAFSSWRKKDLPIADLLKQRVFRILPILLIGYFLHVPYFSAFRIIVGLTGDEWQRFLQCDILQTIGYTVIGMQLIFMLVKSTRLRALLSLAAAAAILAFTPVAQALRSLPLPLVQLVSSARGSPFPLFPFAAYLFAGVFLGYLFLWLGEKARPFLILGCFCFIGAALFAASFTNAAPHIKLFMFRTGILLILCSVFLLFEKNVHPVVEFFTTLGQESLVIYYIHIMVVYGSAINKGFVNYLGTHLNTLQSVIAALALTAVMILLGLGWSYIKEKDREFSRLIRNALAASVLLVFLANP
ncbi:MAG TPA: acyltransferase family protein [bacterium]